MFENSNDGKGACDVIKNSREEINCNPIKVENGKAEHEGSKDNVAKVEEWIVSSPNPIPRSDGD